MEKRWTLLLAIAVSGMITFCSCNEAENKENETKKEKSDDENTSSNTEEEVENEEELHYEIVEALDDEGNIIYNEDGTIKRDTIFYAKKPEIDTSKYGIFSILDPNTGEESFIIHNKINTDTKNINTPCECTESLTDLLKNFLNPKTNDAQLSSPKEMVQAYKYHYEYIFNHCAYELKFQKNDWKDCKENKELTKLTQEYEQILKSGEYLVTKVDENRNVVFNDGGSAVKDTVVFDN